MGLLCGLQAAYAEKQDEKYDKVFKNFYTRVEYVDDLTAVEAAADKFTVYLPKDVYKRQVADEPAQQSTAHHQCAAHGTQTQFFQARFA